MSTDAADPTRRAAQRSWIAAALRDGNVESDLDGNDVEELVAIADYEGVLPLLEWRLRNGGAWNALPGLFSQALTEAARIAAIQALSHERELRRLSAMLAQDEIQCLLLKGPALARWLYPQPYLRAISDIDLLFASRGEADRAVQAFAALGYKLSFLPTNSVYEMTCLPAAGTDSLELDLHSRLINTEAYAHRFSFDELLGASRHLQGLSPGLRALGNLHALLHACLHRAHDACLHRPDRLKWLYDIHLILERMDIAAWRAFNSMATVKDLCGVCLRSVQDTIEVFGTQVPDGAMDELREHAAGESLDWRRLHDWRYMQGQNLRALPTMRARLRWLWERLVPSRSHLQTLHGEGGFMRLMARRMGRGLSRFADRS